MHDYLWWRDGVIYQVYPRSFYDSDGDGLGDLPGITQKLDYIANLGVDAIWLSPFYPTPDKDFGYDISDYCDVDPRFGSLADFDDLLQAAHARGLKVVLDLVLNHTSDQHPWFQQSRSSRDHPKRDWYLWRDPKPNGKPPNNWPSVFGGSGWELDPHTGQYFLHLFVKEQADVNWRNPELRQAMLDVVCFWLGRGADGFRLDVFNAYFKDAQFKDNPSLPIVGMKHIYDIDQPEMFPLLKELRQILDAHPGSYAVGETFLPSPQKAAMYAGEDKLHASFSFEFTGTMGFGSARLTPKSIMEHINRREQAFAAAGAWPTTVMGNHDVPRPASRYSRTENDAMPRLAMALLLTLRGTPYLYYGDEIGMRELKLRRDQILDPVGKAFWPIIKGRDGCRTPMQWDDSPQAGFSSTQPWLAVHENYPTRNVAAQAQDPASIYNLTRDLLHLRKCSPALQRGDMAFIHSGAKSVLAFTRTIGAESVLVLLNLSARAAQTTALTALGSEWRVLYASPSQPELDEDAGFRLQPYQVCVLITQ
jgi:alpha-glucosidase